MICRLIDLVLGRSRMGLYSDLYILHADLDMYRRFDTLLLSGRMACLSHEKPLAQLFHVDKP
jgi:hypothetical protein